METRYRKTFLRDLKKLKKLPVYDAIFNLAFTIIPETTTLRDISNMISMQSQKNRYRIRIGKYRVGIEVIGNKVEMLRVLHRRDFYRYFP